MRILIVDDSKAMRIILKRTLCQAGYQDYVIEEAANGVEAFEMIRNSSPDLVLTDWNMPEMNGMQLLQTIKQNGLATKLGFVTSEGTPEMKRKAEEEGAVFLISKPFTVETFQQTLARVL